MIGSQPASHGGMTWPLPRPRPSISSARPVRPTSGSVLAVAGSTAGAAAGAGLGATVVFAIGRASTSRWPVDPLPLAAFVGALTGTVLEARRMGTALDPVQIDRAVRLVLLRGMEDRIALERVLSGFVAPGYHP